MSIKCLKEKYKTQHIHWPTPAGSQIDSQSTWLFKFVDIL